MDIESVLKQYGGNEKFCSAIYNSPTPCLGVKIPILRTLAKSLELQTALQLPYGYLIEYDLLKGLVIVNAKLPFCEKSKLLTDFACNIDSWATTDTCIVKVKSSEKAEYFDYFCSLTQYQQPFCIRYGVVNLMRNYLDQEYLPQLLKVIANIKYGHYYIDMAVAWFIAEVATIDRTMAQQILSGGNLPTQVVKYALQKMRDSRRVDSAVKEWTYSLLKK